MNDFEITESYFDEIDEGEECPRCKCTETIEINDYEMKCSRCGFIWT